MKKLPVLAIPPTAVEKPMLETQLAEDFGLSWVHKGTREGVSNAYILSESSRYIRYGLVSGNNLYALDFDRNSGHLRITKNLDIPDSRGMLEGKLAEAQATHWFKLPSGGKLMIKGIRGLEYIPDTQDSIAKYRGLLSLQGPYSKPTR